MGVSACEFDNTTPSLAGSFERRSLFKPGSGCNGSRRVRGSRCARFEVHTVDGKEDISELLLLVVLQGGCIVESHDNILTAFGIDYDAIGLGKL